MAAPAMNPPAVNSMSDRIGLSVVGATVGIGVIVGSIVGAIVGEGETRGTEPGT